MDGGFYNRIEGLIAIDNHYYLRYRNVSGDGTGEHYDTLWDDRRTDLCAYAP